MRQCWSNLILFNAVFSGETNETVYFSCEINSFVEFKYQVYPKCVPSQRDDVNDRRLEMEYGDYCVKLNDQIVVPATNKFDCLQWS